MRLGDHPHWKRAAGPLVVVMLGAWPLIRSWTLGPDVQVDFGRELYVPWRLAEGEHLYRDIAYFNGPLSAYWHALWFKVAGVGLTTLKTLNLITVIGVTTLIVRLALRTSTAFAAYGAASFFVAAIAFGQVLNIGNYDFLTPYSHELTHGLALSLWGLFEFARRNETSTAYLRCGAILALVFLTKMEAFAALGLAMGIGLALEWNIDRTDEKASSPGLASNLAQLSLAFAVAVAIAFGALGASIGFADAAAGIVEPLRAIVGTNVVGLAYYQWVMGTGDIADSLSKIGIGLVIYGLSLAVIVALSLVWKRFRLERFSPVAGLALLGTSIAFPMTPFYAINSIRPLALIIPGLLAWLVYLAIKRRERSSIFAASVVAFGFGLQAKMLLNAQFGHYGFALLMPSTLVVVVALLGWMPQEIERRGGSAVFFRLAATALLLSVALGLNARTDLNAKRRSEPVGQGVDAMMSDFRADDVLRALYFLEGTDPSASVAVLPEGVMLNYLARRKNPTPYINFMPPEFSMYGDQSIVDAFESNPPDYLLFVHKRTGLYGYTFFGRDYGEALYQWANANYQMVRQIGDRPFEDRSRFGITILERKSGR